MLTLAYTLFWIVLLILTVVFYFYKLYCKLDNYRYWVILTRYIFHFHLILIKLYRVQKLLKHFLFVDSLKIKKLSDPSFWKAQINRRVVKGTVIYLPIQNNWIQDCTWILEGRIGRLNCALKQCYFNCVKQKQISLVRGHLWIRY